MKFEYSLEQRPPFAKSFLYGLQWAAIAISLIIILGKVAGSLHFSRPADLIVYLQKMFFLTGVTLACQVWWGRHLPVICGPATVLLIGVIAGRGFEINVIYSSIMAGGGHRCLSRSSQTNSGKRLRGGRCGGARAGTCGL